MHRTGFVFLASILLFSSFGCLQAQPEEGPPRDLEILISGPNREYTLDSDVTLSLFANGASECRFSDDGESWGEWEPYQETREWTLSGDDGFKQVFYQCRNRDGDLSIPVAATIILDRSPPEISLESPVEGQQYVGTSSIIFTATDNLAESLQCSARLDGNPMKVGVVTSGRRQEISIYASEGTHELVLRCKDGISTTEESVSFDILKAPSVKLMIGGGSGYADKRNVTLTAESPTATECRFSNKRDEWGEWLPYSESVPWELTAKDGTKNVYAQCRDSQGTLSAVVSDSIMLDSSPPPYISLAINNDLPWTNSRDVDLGLYAFAASECRYSNDGETWSAWEAYSRKKEWTLTEGEEEKTVYYNCRAKDGSDIGTVTSTITYSSVPTNPPSLMNITINGGSEYTSSDTVSLELSALGAYQCRFREGNLEWTAWEDYATKSSFILSGNDGAKTIYYQCRNDYGTSTVHSRIYLDRTAPGTVTGLRGVSSPYSVTIYWNVATDQGAGVKYYQVLRKDGVKAWAGISTGLSFKDERVIPGQTYQYSVQAVDHNGNSGAESSSVSITVPEPA